MKKLIEIFENGTKKFPIIHRTSGDEYWISCPKSKNKKEECVCGAEEAIHHHLTHTTKLLEGIVEEIKNRKRDVKPRKISINTTEKAQVYNQALNTSLAPIKELLDKLKEKI